MNYQFLKQRYKNTLKLHNRSLIGFSVEKNIQIFQTLFSVDYFSLTHELTLLPIDFFEKNITVYKQVKTANDNCEKSNNNVSKFDENIYKYNLINSSSSKRLLADELANMFYTWARYVNFIEFIIIYVDYDEKILDDALINNNLKNFKFQVTLTVGLKNIMAQSNNSLAHYLNCFFIQKTVGLKINFLNVTKLFKRMGNETIKSQVRHALQKKIPWFYEEQAYCVIAYLSAVPLDKFGSMNTILYRFPASNFQNWWFGDFEECTLKNTLYATSLDLGIDDSEVDIQTPLNTFFNRWSDSGRLLQINNDTSILTVQQRLPEIMALSYPRFKGNEKLILVNLLRITFYSSLSYFIKTYAIFRDLLVFYQQFIKLKDNSVENTRQDIKLSDQALGPGFSYTGVLMEIRKFLKRIINLPDTISKLGSRADILENFNDEDFANFFLLHACKITMLETAKFQLFEDLVTKMVETLPVYYTEQINATSLHKLLILHKSSLKEELLIGKNLELVFPINLINTEF